MSYPWERPYQEALDTVLIPELNQLVRQYLSNGIYDDAGRLNGITVNGEKVGKWTYWWENGVKWYEGEYQNGKREGLWTYWWDNGQKQTEGEYQNGKQEGLWIYWGKNGDKWYEGEYRNGKQEGLWTFWHENGELDRVHKF